jgi:alpha-tubulin suppressor-like RCC1 family protein
MRSPLIQRARLGLAILVTLVAALCVVQVAAAEQASSGVRVDQGGYLDVGDEHTCAVLADRTVRCWGRGLAGRLGYGDEQNVLSAAAAAPVNVGAGRWVRAVTAGDFHTCAILDDGSVRCWGFGANGRLGYGDSADVRSTARGVHHRRRVAHLRDPR